MLIGNGGCHTGALAAPEGKTARSRQRPRAHRGTIRRPRLLITPEGAAGHLPRAGRRQRRRWDRTRDVYLAGDTSRLTPAASGLLPTLLNDYGILYNSGNLACSITSFDKM